MRLYLIKKLYYYYYWLRPITSWFNLVFKRYTLIPPWRYESNVQTQQANFHKPCGDAQLQNIYSVMPIWMKLYFKIRINNVYVQQVNATVVNAKTNLRCTRHQHRAWNNIIPHSLTGHYTNAKSKWKKITLNNNKTHGPSAKWVKSGWLENKQSCGIRSLDVSLLCYTAHNAPMMKSIFYCYGITIKMWFIYYARVLWATQSDSNARFSRVHFSMKIKCENPSWWMEIIKQPLTCRGWRLP